MAISMMKAMIVGNVGRVEDIETTQTGSPKLRFSVAVNTWDSRSNSKVANWWSVMCFGKQAENAVKFLKKGIPVAVVGDMRAEVVVKEGKGTFLNLNIMADNIVGMGPREGGESYEGNPATTAPAAAVAADSGSVAGGDVDPDDIPF